MKPSAITFLFAELFLAINVPLAIANGWLWTAAAYVVGLFVLWKFWKAMQ